MHRASDSPSSRNSPEPSPIPSSSGSTSAVGPAGSRALLRPAARLAGVPRRLRVRRLEVPLDYAKPDGKTIEVAVLKATARNDDERLGSIVYDPGGPGVSGADYATNPESLFGPAVLEHYDIVGPRPARRRRQRPGGVPARRPARRGPDRRPRPGHPGGGARRPTPCCAASVAAAWRRAATSPGTSPPSRSAKDLDVLRAASGENKLTYFGASYGTAIGATYADLFPKNVGRMVLDGALDPRSSTLDLNLVQAPRLRDRAACVRRGVRRSRGSCFLGSTVDEGIARIQAVPRRGRASSRCRAGQPRARRGQRVLRHRLPALRQGRLGRPRQGAAERRSTATARC